MRAIALALGLAMPAFCGNAYVSARTGSWTDPATWTCTPGPCTTPGDGDTASIANGHAVTADSNITIGASGAINTTPAIALNASGKLTVAGGVAIRVRGDVLYTGGGNLTDAVAMQAGSTWVFDSTVSLARYRFGPASGTVGARAFVANGTVQSHVAITSDTAGGAPAGFFGNANVGAAQGSTYGGGVRAAYADFSNIGDAGISGFYLGINATYSTAWQVSDSTFTNCGNIESTVLVPATGVFVHTRNEHTRSAGATPILVNFGSVNTTGTRTITSNVFDKLVFGTTTGITRLMNNVTVNDNYFGGSLNPGQPGGSGPKWNTFRGNLVLPYKFSSIASAIGGDAEDNYWFGATSGGDGYLDNLHYVQWSGLLPHTVSGNIFGQADDVNTDSGEVMLHSGTNPGSPVTQTITGNIIVPTKTGKSAAELSSIGGPTVRGNLLFVIDHNTWTGGALNGTFGMIQTEESGAAAPGQIRSLKSNIAWSPLANPPRFFKLRTSGPMTTVAENVVDPANGDYNLDYGAAASEPGCVLCINQGNSYVDKFTATPGQHDVTADPMFADYKRNLELYDSKYLGNRAGAWSSGAAYGVGDMVSVTEPAIYWGLPVNYRCTAAHTAADGTKPGIGASWRTSWEFASLYRLREGIKAQTRITDGATGAKDDTPIMALIKWVRRGYTPTNPAIRQKAHDGTAPGAVAMDAPAFFGPVVF